MLLMLFTTHRSVLVSIRALSGDMLYARHPLGFRFTTHSQKECRRPGPKKQVPAANKTLSRLGILFSHVFCNEIPYTESDFWHPPKRSVEEALRPRSHAIFQKNIF